MGFDLYITRAFRNASRSADVVIGMERSFDGDVRKSEDATRFRSWDNGWSQWDERRVVMVVE